MDNFESIGKILQQKREQKNISLDLVAQKTKININILKHLENDELDKLPNKTYVRGFVSNYARTIGWDQSEAKQALAQTYANLTGEPESEEPGKTHLGSLQVENQVTEENDELKETFVSIVQSFFNKKILISIAVVLVLAVIGKGIVSFFSQLNYEHQKISESSPEKSPLKNEDKNILEMDANKKFAEETLKENAEGDKTLASESEVENADEEVAQAEAEVAQEKEPEQEVADKNEEESDPIKVVKTPKGKFPFKKFYQAPLNTFEIVEDSPEAADPNLLPDNIRLAKVEGKQNVFLHATDGDTWIAYQADDQPIKKYVLKKGRSVLIRGDVVKVFMGNYNVAKVFYNNQLIKAYTRTGVKSLIFPEGAGKDLKLPLFPTFQGRSYTSAEYIEKMVKDSEEI